MASAESTPPPQPPSQPNAISNNDLDNPQSSRGGRGRGRGRPRARGRGRGRGGHPGPRAVRPEDLEDGDERAAKVEDAKKEEDVAEVTEAVAKLSVKPEKPSDASAPAASPDANETPASPTTPGPGSKKKERAPRKPPVADPYENPDRINTGGLKNDKLSPEELDKVMERMRQKNQEILARREEVEADQYHYSASVAAEVEKSKEEEERKQSEQRANAAKYQEKRKVQQKIDATRSEAVERKLSKQEGREWDADKGDDWANSRGTYAPRRAGRGGGRGGRPPRGGGRGGRGGGPSPRPSEANASGSPSGGPKPSAGASTSSAPAAAE